MLRLLILYTTKAAKDWTPTLAEAEFSEYAWVSKSQLHDSKYETMLPLHIELLETLL